MSVDPFIQAPSSTQSINPYSYIMNNPLAGTDPTSYVSKCNQNPTCQIQSFFSSTGSGGSSLIGNLMGRLKTTLSNGHDTKQAKKTQDPKAAEVNSPAAVSFVLPSKDSVDRTHLANCGRIQQCSGLGNLIRNKLIPPVIGPGNSQNNSGDLSDNGNPPGVNEAYGSELSGVSTPSPGGLPPDDNDKENIRNSDGGDHTKVGRWMSADEFKLMEKTGKVQEGAGGQTFVANSGWRSFFKEAKPGSVYAEFEVPTSSLIRGGKPDWFKMIGPKASRSQQMLLRKQGGEMLPKVRNLIIKTFK